MPGFKFTPQYRSRVWDGKIRLFQYASGQIYVGLYPYILDWCKKNNIQVVDGAKIKDARKIILNLLLYAQSGAIGDEAPGKDEAISEGLKWIENHVS